MHAHVPVQVDMVARSCQAPDDLHSCIRGPLQCQHNHQPSLRAQDVHQEVLQEFVQWAAPRVLTEIARTAAACNGTIAAGAGLMFGPIATASATGACAMAGVQQQSGQAVLAGELQLRHDSLLAGRLVVALCAPATPADAAAAAAAVHAAGGSTPSSHLLATCCGPVRMSAEAALKAHGLPGMGCLCVWDLAAAGSNVAIAGASPRSTPRGLLQLLTCEGQPTCCCWGVGAAACLLFAGAWHACGWRP